MAIAIAKSGLKIHDANANAGTGGFGGAFSNNKQTI
jgi:hypothetical protein